MNKLNQKFQAPDFYDSRSTKLSMSGQKTPKFECLRSKNPKIRLFWSENSTKLIFRSKNSKNLPKSNFFDPKRLNGTHFSIQKNSNNYNFLVQKPLIIQIKYPLFIFPNSRHPKNSIQTRVFNSQSSPLLSVFKFSTTNHHFPSFPCIKCFKKYAKVTWSFSHF